ncbi:membrane protein insertion efficiency factor YidD [Robbsia sp. KACC 23696]|uniref:membrane protein insertion efficiency factor YidD n=1 Tax=Robbsia sp. KACC 23696 TaxID=3149231 RepID=UPI00325B7EA8
MADDDLASAWSRVLRVAGSAVRLVLLGLLRFYKLGISPLLGNRCRFYPSCSDYAKDAIQYHGAARGSYLAFRRVCRCHPFSAGGLDPVPPAPGQRGNPHADAETDAGQSARPDRSSDSGAER